MPPIIFVLYPHMLATSVTLPLEMLRAAWAMAKIHNPRLKPLHIEFRSDEGQTVNTHTGLALNATPLSEPLNAGSLIFLPALWRDPLKVIAAQPNITAWLKQNGHQNTLAAVGTGVCFLAEAGLLNHQPATTHWHFFDKFETRYPLVRLKRDLFITRSARLFCTASTNALAELTAFFIQEQYGERIAQAVERNFFHEIRQSRTQVSLNTQNPANTDELVALATAKLDELSLRPYNPNSTAKTINIGDLALQLHVSVRSLNRHFQQALNLSPLQYLLRKRMSIAEELLKTSNLSMADIANHAGFQDPQHFARQFKKTFGVAPSQYRTTVRGKIFT